MRKLDGSSAGEAQVLEGQGPARDSSLYTEIRTWSLVRLAAPHCCSSQQHTVGGRIHSLEPFILGSKPLSAQLPESCVALGNFLTSVCLGFHL